MKQFLAILLLTAICSGQTLPDAPSKKVADKKFWTAVGAAGAALAVDAYTTTAFIGDNHPCNVESGTPWLYGTRPKNGRLALTMSGEFALSVTASYLLKRKGFRKLWFAPLALSFVQHSRGAAHNYIVCR